jgi:hypothetical protein
MANKLVIVSLMALLATAAIACPMDSPRQSLVPNIHVDVEIMSKPGPIVPSLPCSKVFTNGERQFAWVAKTGRAEERLVQAGQSTSTRIEITGGFSAGDKIIVPGNIPISEGMRVQVTGG